MRWLFVGGREICCCDAVRLTVLVLAPGVVTGGARGADALVQTGHGGRRASLASCPSAAVSKFPPFQTF